jgi:hypothetical protein
MNTYITDNHSRKEYLIANSISKEYSGTLTSFSIENIYEIAFNKQHKATIVLDDQKIKTSEIHNFIKDFVTTAQTKTKLVLLSENKVHHENIFTLPSSSYRCFNEYYRPRKITTSKFVLCHLDTDNHKNNIVIENIVYPKNKEIPIRLVGHPGIQHIQNVGVVTDDHMLDLIYSCSVYINISNQYVYDAMLYNKPILSSIENEYLLSKNNLELQDLKELFENQESKEHNHNLKQYKISNIVKSILKL